jgi:intein/homing endonuclease
MDKQIKTRKQSNLQKLSTSYKSFSKSNFINLPRSDQDLKDMRTQKLAIKYCNDRSISGITKIQWCKDHQISHNTLNKSLEKIGFVISHRKHKKPGDHTSLKNNNIENPKPIINKNKQKKNNKTNNEKLTIKGPFSGPPNPKDANYSDSDMDENQK